MKHALFGVAINVGSREEVLSECRSLVGRGGAVFTVNSLMLERARRSPNFARVLNSADLLTADGVGVKRALALRGVRADTLPGVELGELITQTGSPSLAIIGGREGVADSAFSYLKVRSPALRHSFLISGYGHGEDEYLSLLERHRPKICFVCLGSPRQELFTLAARAASPKTLFFALGGSLDIYSGRLHRAPLLMRRLGLEWLYRMMREPHRAAELTRLASFALASLMPNATKNKQKNTL